MPGIAYPQAADRPPAEPAAQARQHRPTAPRIGRALQSRQVNGGEWPEWGSPTIEYIRSQLVADNRISKDFNAAVIRNAAATTRFTGSIACGRTCSASQPRCLTKVIMDGSSASDNAGRQAGRHRREICRSEGPRLTPPAGANPRFRQKRSYKAVRATRCAKHGRGSQVVQEACDPALALGGKSSGGLPITSRSQSRRLDKGSAALALGQFRTVERFPSAIAGKDKPQERRKNQFSVSRQSSMRSGMPCEPVLNSTNRVG